MELEVYYNSQNCKGNSGTHIIKITKLMLLKHLAFSGQGIAPRPQKLFRTLGVFLHYSQYLKFSSLDSNKFSEPPKYLSDPTEKGQFSNIVGKGIADFLSKKIGNSIFTVNYEAFMRRHKIKIIGKRPDLVAFSPDSIFTIEAKGRCSDHPGDISLYEQQGVLSNNPLNFDIPINYFAISVSFNLYNKIKCFYKCYKYPQSAYRVNQDYDRELLREISKKYYSGLFDFLKKELFRKEDIILQGEKFYEVELLSPQFMDFLPNKFNQIFKSIKIILPGNINEYAEKGIDKDYKPFIFDINKNENIYTDVDRVGLKIVLNDS